MTEAKYPEDDARRFKDWKNPPPSQMRWVYVNKPGPNRAERRKLAKSLRRKLDKSGASS